jgi:uncharacterized membrane protein YbaN (DUF454 family)
VIAASTDESMTNDGRRSPLNGRPWKRLALLGAGWLFVLLGIAGLFLPILQGILFLLIGIYLLSLASPRARLLRQRAKRWLGNRYPEHMMRLEAAEHRAKAWIQARSARVKGWFGHDSGG